MNELGFLISAAEGYANLASNIFSMFLTVMFSSFAFAAALPLGSIGARVKFFSYRLSTSSIWVGISLLAFYMISFISFNKASEKAETLSNAIKQILEKRTHMNPDVIKVFATDSDIIFCFGLPSVGFIIGSTIGLLIFLWITNVERTVGSKT